VGLLDRPGVARVAEAAEEYLGVAVRPKRELDRLALVEQEFTALAGDAEDMALHAMDYFTGRPHELGSERRRRIAQRSRIALKFDPLAGAEAQILADFSFGKGVPKPTARDEQVQQVIDEAWTDANNEEKLTGSQAWRKLSNELLTSGELFLTLYVAGGRIRVGRLDPDTVEAVVPDPEDRLRPLWYMTRHRRFRWDFTNDRAAIEDELTEQGKPRLTYWKHWRNYDDAVAEREQGIVEPGENEMITPPEEKQAKGVVYHLGINQTGEELRGNPPWARQLRFFTAMNELTEAHVVMAQGASTFIAKRVMRGTPKQVIKAASSTLGHLSELGSQRIGAGRPASDEPVAFAPGAQAPAPPASWWNENESARLESLSLNSGAAQMAQTAQIVRAPIAAAAQFGQHYFGDASNANLATASTLELPADMRIEGWQALFEQIARWFTDRAIEAAAKAGRFGGLDGFPEEGPMSEMRLHEAEDRAKMERRTKKDLSYEFVMPFPGRRQLPEVGTYVQTVASTMDPNGVSIPMRRHLLRFAFEQMGIDDVGHAVEECIPDKPLPGGIGPQPEPQIDPQTGMPVGQPPPPGASSAPPATSPPSDRPAGAKKGTTVGGKPTSPTYEEWIPAELRQPLDAFEGETAAIFSRLVSAPAVAAVLQVAGSSNGNGNGSQ
jgi:hypothetical protein